MNINKVIILLSFVFTGTCFSQETRTIDSLKAYIANAPDDTNKVNALFKLGRQYDPFKSKQHIENYISALTLSKKIDHLKGRNKIYTALVANLFYKNMYGLAMTYGMEQLDYLNKYGTEQEKHDLYMMLGNLNSTQKKFNEAQSYYNLALNYHQRSKNEVAIARTLMNITLLKMEQQQLDTALIYSFRALELFKRNNQQSYAANTTLGISEIFLSQKKYEAAEQKAKESDLIYKMINLKQGLSNTNYVLGRIKSEQNKPKEAITNFSISLNYADTLNLLVPMRDCFKMLSEQYEKLNDHKNAYDYYVKFKNYDDSLDLEVEKEKILELEVKYDISKKENLLLEQTAQIESQSKQRNLLLLGLSAILLLLFISFRAYKQKKNSSEIISKQKHIVEDKQKEILDSINYAQRIQKAILAREEEIKQHLKESFLLYRPKDIIAGDFYFFEVTKTNIFYAAADCTGHGVPGALMSVVCSNALTRCVKEFGLVKPGEILDKTRELVVETLKKSGEEVKDGIDISLISVSRNNLSNIQWAGANNPLWYTKNNILVEIKADKQPIGLSDNTKPFTTHLLDLNKGDILFLFTDGFADQFGGPKAKKFKYKQFQDLLLTNSLKPMQEQLAQLTVSFESWKGSLEQVDDVCVIGIRI
jgi:serine phosphatase RsbU (regulator of sigma subunit)